MKQILLGIAITLMGGVNLYAQSSQDITPAKYKYSTRPVGQETISGFFTAANPKADQIQDLINTQYKGGLFFVCGGQMGNEVNQSRLQEGTSIVDMGGEVGKVLCINGANSDFNNIYNVSYPKNNKGNITGWVNLNWTTDPATEHTTNGSETAPNIHVKIVMNVYAGSTNQFKDLNIFDYVKTLGKADGKEHSTQPAVIPNEFYTEGSYDITRWMTYEFDTYCNNSEDSKPLRLTLNISNKGAINNTTIFIKEISFTEIDPANKTGFKKSFSTISATALTLDETYTSNTIKDLTGANFTLNRQMASGKWNTFCVPFALTSEQIDAAFGKDTEVRKYVGANGNVLTFAKATDIEAGTPYLIKPTKAAEKYIFNNVNVTTTEPAKVGEGDIKFCGVYNQANVDDLAETGSHVSGIVDNMVKRAKTGTSIKGFRAYFSVPNSTTEAAEAALRVAIDGETTGIDAIEGFETKTPTRVYNLSGQYVGTSTANLKPGVYVSGGKKVIVK